MKHKWNKNETKETKVKPSVTKWNLGQCSCFSKICLPNGECNPQWSALNLEMLCNGFHYLRSTLEEWRSINCRIPSNTKEDINVVTKLTFYLSTGLHSLIWACALLLILMSFFYRCCSLVIMDVLYLGYLIFITYMYMGYLKCLLLCMSLGTIELMPPVSVTGTTLLKTHSPFDWYDIYVDLRYAIMYLLIDTALIDILYWYFHLILWFLGSL